jgi:hypothetical protein
VPGLVSRSITKKHLTMEELFNHSVYTFAPHQDEELESLLHCTLMRLKQAVTDNR